MDQIRMYSNYKQHLGLLPANLVRRQEDDELSGLLKRHGFKIRVASAVSTHSSAAGYESLTMKLVHTSLGQLDARQQPHFVNIFTAVGEPKALDGVLKTLHEFYTERGYEPCQSTLVL